MAPDSSFARRFLLLPFGLAWLLLAALVARGQVIISEFEAANKHTLADEEKDYPDWVELYNTNAASVNLGGWSLTDDSSHRQRWIFPQTNLVAKGFLVVFASGKNRVVPGAPLHTDFKLNADGEYLALLQPDGTVASEFSPAFPPQYQDISYGLAEDVVTNTFIASGAQGRYLIPANAALGSNWTAAEFNDSKWSSGVTGMGYETAVAGFAVVNYVANVGVCSLDAAESVIANPAQQLAVFSENAPVINYLNTVDSAHYDGDRTFPGLIVGVDQDNFAVEATATITIPAPGSWTFGVNSDDGFSLTIGSFGVAYPDPRGPSDTLQTFDFPAAGDYPLRLVYYECGGGSEVELFAAQGSFSGWDATHFRLVGDEANGGLGVKSLVVSGGNGGSSYRRFIQTDTQTAMSGINATAYLRVPFVVADSTSVQSLTLRMKYDDGFIAWLNGEEIARRNAPDSAQWNSTAAAPHPNYQAVVFEEINVSDHLGALRSGANVLAIQGLNQSAGDTDFLLLPELVEYKASATGERYFSQPTPGALNNSGFIAFVADTKFSVDRGFYDTPFSVAITSATVGATIIYTTNGSVPSLANGLIYSAPLTIQGTTCLRAAAFKEGFLPSDVDTQTYIFANDVIHQSPNGETPPGWPSSWGGNVVDYGMDPNVINDPAYSPEIVKDLKSIPTYSLVTDFANLFDPTTGIYANPDQDGIAWERPASIELIYPDGKTGFHVNAGIRIRGGYSRSGGNPKHAFRFFFRANYGAGSLQFPVFANQDGTDSFEGYDLRTMQNYSWSFEGDYRFIGMRDQRSRDTQFAMGQPAERGDFYHLYINGEYWGLYNTCERPEASYAASYFGGSKQDYDVIKVNTGAGYTIFATDGTMDAWTRLWQAATNGFASDTDYYRVQGLNLDGTPNPAYENLVDVDNLIDHMLLIFFVGNIDAPISAFLGDQNPNNVYAFRDRTGKHGGFRFVAHDSEHTLLHESSLGNPDELHRDRTGPFPAGDPLQQGADGALARSNPQYIFSQLTANAEFRLRVADHIHRRFFNGGVLTTESCRARLTARSNEIYGAVACESARWGDSKTEPPRTRNVDWAAEMSRVYGDYFDQRPGIVLDQLRAKGWYPAVNPPAFNQFGGIVTNGFQLELAAPVGTIYYTRDGSDPRLRGGGISPLALAWSGPIALSQGVRIRARALSGGNWSALADATFYIIHDFAGSLVVSEIMYHPPNQTSLDGDEFEFIELKNVGDTDLDLSGVHFTNGITYTFPVGSAIAPGRFLVLVSNPTAFAAKYPGVRVDGVYSGNLSNQGEKITLDDVSGTNLFSVSYGESSPWPMTADGAGFSLVPVNPNVNPDPSNPANWRASSRIGGSPGSDDVPSNILPILVNEVLTHTDLPQLDSVELYNPNAVDVDVGDWYLTDQRTVPAKFRIPSPSIIAANGYLVFTENDWNSDPASTNHFRLDSHGDEIYLYSADSSGNLTGYSDGFAFGAAQNGVSFGRYRISTGDARFPAQRLLTLGSTNSGPRVGPVVINEIFYHPAPGGSEFIELKSVTKGLVRLYDPDFPTNAWRVNGVGYSFPPNTELAPNGLLLLVAIQPEAFRTQYGVPAEVAIFGPYSGTLQHSGETLALQCPDHPDVNTNTGAIFVPYFDIDSVRYNDKAPWPTDADGLGASLERLDSTAYGDDPINWRASPGGPSPGLDNLGNRQPLVNAGPDQSIAATGAPIAVQLTGSVRDDGLPNPPGTIAVSWRQISGPAAAWFSDASLSNAIAYFPGGGQYTLRLTADDGALQAKEDAVFTIQHSIATIPFTLIPKGSVWNYLDDGSDQGTAWVQTSFNDAAWPSGPAPLGYGDANGQLPSTINNFGPDPNNKYLTTYYRRHFAVTDAASVADLTVSVQRDDGVVLYLNGTPIYTNNMPTDTAIGYRTAALAAVGGSDETAFYSQSVNPRLLVNGDNVLAAEIHQANGTSSDIIFDLQLSGDGAVSNSAPSVSAGLDQSVTLPSPALLLGTVADDGLPIPPGLLSFAWSKISGPGSVTFKDSSALQTTADFEGEGSYVLRLTASDGALAVVSDLTITVKPQALVAAHIESCGIADGNPPLLRLSFTTTPSQGYAIEYRDSLESGTWLSLTNITAQPLGQSVEVTDPILPGSPRRFYRITTLVSP